MPGAMVLGSQAVEEVLSSPLQGRSGEEKTAKRKREAQGEVVTKLDRIP